jgi:hypothetical protein
VVVLCCIAGTIAGTPYARSAEPVAASVKGKQPIPTSDEQQQANKLVRDVYKKDLANAVRMTEKAAIAKAMLEQSKQPGNDVATQYALLKMAQDLSVSGNDAETAISAIDQLAAKFVVDDMVMRTDALKAVGSKATITGQKQVLAAALDGVQQATAREQFDVALRLVGIAIESARRRIPSR